MDKKFAFLLFLSLFSLAADSLADSNETILMVTGGRHDFSISGSNYTMLLVGLTRGTATFVVSGMRVAPGVNETKVVDLTKYGVGDIEITLNDIMPNGTVSVTLSQQIEGSVCKPINDRCAGLYECCVGECIAGLCNYRPTAITNATVNVNLDAPSNVTPGDVVKLKITREDGSPVSDAIVDVILPTYLRLTLTTNESGEGIYLANQEGNYSYAVYDYILNSNITTLSGKPALPPIEKPKENATTQPEEQKKSFCGDGICSVNESCSTCPKDCGACPSLPLPTSAPTAEESQDNTWFIWPILMLVVIIFILRVLVPLFVRDE